MTAAYNWKQENRQTFPPASSRTDWQKRAFLKPAVTKNLAISFRHGLFHHRILKRSGLTVLTIKLMRIAACLERGKRKRLIPALPEGRRHDSGFNQHVRFLQWRSLGLSLVRDISPACPCVHHGLFILTFASVRLMAASVKLEHCVTAPAAKPQTAL
jgi:hypothetical protein